MEVIAVEVAAAFGQHVAFRAGRMAYRQSQAVRDPSYHTVTLDKAVGVLERVIGFARFREDLSPALERVDWQMMLASDLIRQYKNMPARARAVQLTSMSKKMKDMRAKLTEETEELAEALKDEPAFNLAEIREKVEKERSRKFRKKVGKLAAALVAELEEEVHKEQGQSQAKISELFFRISAIVGEDAATSELVAPATSEYLQKFRSAIDDPAPWQESGPDALGVLGVHHVKVLTPGSVFFPYTGDFHYHTGDFLTRADASYEVRMEGDRLKAFMAALGIKKVQVNVEAPLMAITVDEFTRQLLLIPTDARYFTFSYPISSSSDVGSLGDLGFLELLLLHGGFMYFDADKAFVSANCFVSNQSTNPFVSFNGPHELPAPVSAALAKAKRFRTVTEATLRGLGADGFCWVAPGEEIAGSTAQDRALWKHGAFAYMYPDAPEKNNFYAVASMADILGLDEAKLKKPTHKMFGASFGGQQANSDLDGISMASCAGQCAVL